MSNSKLLNDVTNLTSSACDAMHFWHFVMESGRGDNERLKYQKQNSYE